ncbi:Uncharacterised protein [Mycobacteroides abscessus subsp. abscessus]|nr:Uncharacterised protein [Mycobacteroides abscessus subsp. abscessus]
MNVAVVADTKFQAQALAEQLGLDKRFTFGSRSEQAFTGLIADRVLIDSYADVPERFLQTIYATVAKRGGKVRRISVRPAI